MNIHFPPIPDAPQPPGSNDETIWEGIQDDGRELWDNFGIPAVVCAVSLATMWCLGTLIQREKQSSARPPISSTPE